MAKRGPKQETVQDLIHKEAYAALEQLGGKAFHEEDIIFKGDQLILPEKNTLDEVIQTLTKKKAEWENDAEFLRIFNYRPWDVAYCANNALKRAFGVVGHNHRIVMTFFGPEKAPPQMLTVPTGPHTSEQVPWGALELPFLPKVAFHLGATNDKQHGQVGYVNATGPKKHRFAIQGIFDLIEKELEENSLYRGKAFDGQDTPQFLDLSKIDPDKIIYSHEVLRNLEASLWTPLVHNSATKKMKLPFKRAVMLAGDFGVGKSLAINRTGQIAEQEGVTFILVRPGRDDLRQAMLTARMYQPAVVAFEDVETLASSENDAATMSEILDLFDGIEAKNSEVMLVLTSNHAEKLHAGMLRPGRLDDLIHIGPPDTDGIRRLVEVNMPDGTLADTINWQEVGESMESYLPAFIVEASQRALRYMISRTDGKADDKIRTEDLVDSANGLRPQYTLMQAAKMEPVPNRLEDRLQEIVGATVADAFVNWMREQDMEIYQN